MQRRRRQPSSSSPIRKIVLHKSISVVLFVLVILIFIAYSKEAIRAHNINREIKTMASEIEQMESKNKSVFNDIQYYKTLAYLEREARLKMGQQKEGEKVVIVNGDFDKLLSDDQGETDTVVEEETWNPRLWFDYFFGSK